MKNRFYWTDKLFIVDDRTGELKYKFKTHNYCERTGWIYVGVGFNEEKRYMYVQGWILYDVHEDTGIGFSDLHMILYLAIFEFTN
ncbi:MAG: hypothetical protein R2771_03450 [Saprospiraceae bacterium]